MADDSGGLFGIPWNVIGGGGAALGAGSDIFSFIENMQRQQALQKLYRSLTNPADLMKGFTGLSDTAKTAAGRDLGSNWAMMTGGATGGALNQFLADAFAKIESGNALEYMKQRIGALGQAQGAAPSGGQGGAFGNILRSLAILKQLQGQGDKGGIAAGFPSPGGSGYAGGSEAFRDPGAFPPPAADPGTMGYGSGVY